MNISLFFNCCAMIILSSGCCTAGFTHPEELYEGSQCTTEHGSAGICKKLPNCMSKLADVLAGRSRRCGFEGIVEIICCPLKVDDKIGVRPAEIACQQYENEITSDIHADDLETSTAIAKDIKGVDPFIYGGSSAGRREFPYMAALGYENTDGEVSDPIAYNCGGALISSKYILTAAHCVSNINNRVPKWVRVGSEDIRGADAQEIPVDRSVPHPRYRRSQNYNDIALVSLKVAARVSRSVKPICLQTRALRNSNIDSKTSFVTIGFGATAMDQLRSEKLMKSANLNLVPTTTCNESYADFGKLPVGLDDTMICAVDADATRGSDACQGDSGGPLLMITGKAHTVMAITAFGQGCGTVTPGVYTSVHSYLDWIESNVWPDHIKT